MSEPRINSDVDGDIAQWQMRAADLPETLLIGRTEHEWPLEAFSEEAHALGWLEGGNRSPGSHRRRLFRVRLTEMTELEMEPPTPAALRVREGS